MKQITVQDIKYGESTPTGNFGRYYQNILVGGNEMNPSGDVKEKIYKCSCGKKVVFTHSITKITERRRKRKRLK